MEKAPILISFLKFISISIKETRGKFIFKPIFGSLLKLLSLEKFIGFVRQITKSSR